MAIGLHDLSKNRPPKKGKTFKLDTLAEEVKEERTQVRPWENPPQVKNASEVGPTSSLDAYQKSKIIAQQNEVQAKFFRERFNDLEVFSAIDTGSIRFRTAGAATPEADWSFATPFMNLSLWERLKKMLLTFFAD